MNASRRLFSYSLAFAGLLIVLWAARGLLVLVVSTVILQSATLIGAADLRSRASFYLAALIVATPLWLSFWLAAQRRAASVPEERGSIDRRAFFGALFVVTSLVVLFALQRLLRSLLSVPGARESQSPTQEGIEAAARLLSLVEHGSPMLASGGASDDPRTRMNGTIWRSTSCRALRSACSRSGQARRSAN